MLSLNITMHIGSAVLGCFLDVSKAFEMVFLSYTP